MKSVLNISLSWNHLSAVPLSIAGLSTLTHLDLANNTISELPTFLCTLPHLRWLDISANIISEVALGKNSFPSLRHLFMYNNRLKALPVAFAPILARLLSFDCSKNPLLVSVAPPPHARRDNDSHHP